MNKKYSKQELFKKFKIAALYKNYRREGIGSVVFDIFNMILNFFLIFLFVYPFVNQFAVSLSSESKVVTENIFLLPKGFTLESYQYVFSNQELIKGAVISIARVVVGTATCVFATSLLAYIVTVQNFSGRKFMRIVFIVTMYFSGGLIPTYLLYVKLGLTDTFIVYWLPSLFSAYYMLIIGSFMQGIPEALKEAARIDGASELVIFIKIILPMCLPVLAAVAVFVGVSQWNSWFDTSIYNPSGDWDTLQTYLRRVLLEVEAIQKLRVSQLQLQAMRSISPETVRAATTMVVTIPIVMIYPFMQKYFISGIALGAVKE